MVNFHADGWQSRLSAFSIVVEEAFLFQVSVVQARTGALPIFGHDSQRGLGSQGYARAEF